MLRRPHLLVWVLSVQRASRSMLMESRVVSSGSFATTGIASDVRLWQISTIFQERIISCVEQRERWLNHFRGASWMATAWTEIVWEFLPDLNSARTSERFHSSSILHRLLPRVVSLIEDGTTTHIVRQWSGPICQSPSRHERSERQCSISRFMTIDHYIQTADMHLSCRHQPWNWIQLQLTRH